MYMNLIYYLTGNLFDIEYIHEGKFTGYWKNKGEQTPFYLPVKDELFPRCVVVANSSRSSDPVSTLTTVKNKYELASGVLWLKRSNSCLSTAMINIASNQHPELLIGQDSD
jgi:hypothetical protein